MSTKEEESNKKPKKRKKKKRYRPIKSFKKWLIRNKEILGALDSFVTVIGFPIVILGLWLTFKQINEMISKPELNLIFTYPKSTSYYIENSSSKIAEEVQISFMIWDLDTVPIYSLPIETVAITYLNANSKSGPNLIMDKKIRNDKHRYLGYIIATCKNCDKSKKYWLYIDYQDSENSFYSPFTDKEDLWIDLDSTGNSHVKNILNEIPKKRRLKIQGENEVEIYWTKPKKQ